VGALELAVGLLGALLLLLDAFGERAFDAVLLLERVRVGLVQRLDLPHERRGGLGDGRRHFGCAPLGSRQSALQRLYLLAQQILPALRIHLRK
jgi:hypothetical protein